MNRSLSFWELVNNASIVVQCIMLVLVGVSLISWWVIVKKWLMLAVAKKAADQFENDFWSGIDISLLYSRINRKSGVIPSGIEAIFIAGFQEFLRLRSQSTMDIELVVLGTQRAMRAAGSRELDALEIYLPFLATTGSISPYIGLLGTVWGIMNAFIALGVTQQVTLTQVAPGIAEALIATAMGLFAAIPAVIFYNRYAYAIDRLSNRYEMFMEEFANILQRQFHKLRIQQANNTSNR